MNTETRINGSPATEEEMRRENERLNRKITVTLTKKSDHGGSVRFDAPKPEPGKKPNPVQNVYVSRIVPWINDAQAITITIEQP